MQDVIDVARNDARVEISAEALAGMAATREHIEKLANGETPVYGISTGFGALANRVHPFAAAAISSVLFAAIHWYSLAGTIFVFGFGMICCWMTWQCGSLWPSIIAHMLFNAMISATIIARCSFV